MIIVAGASGGIGKALVPLLADLDHVTATYHTKPIGLNHPRVNEVRLDLGSPEDVASFCAGLQSREPLTLLYLAAISPDQLLASTTDEEWKRAFDVNVHGCFLLTRGFLKKMIHDQWGRIIMASSVVAEAGQPGAGAYASSKAAVEGLCQTLAHEYGRFNITANLLTIGYFDQGLIHKLSQSRREEVLGRIPSRQFGNVSNLCHAVDFIRKADYLNGSSIRLDGGLMR